VRCKYIKIDFGDHFGDHFLLASAFHTKGGIDLPKETKIMSLYDYEDSFNAASTNFDDEDEGDVQLHGDIKKIKVLYYKKHSKSARPTRGSLHLGQTKISFKSKGHDFCWDLDAVCIERFKGRVNGGMKIIGKRKQGKEDDEEYIFTMVKQRSYDLIRTSIDQAKFDKELNKVRLNSMHEVAKNGVSMSESLSSLEVDEVRLVTGQGEQPSLLLKPIRFVLMAIFSAFSSIYKIITGRRLFGPKTVHDALHGLLVNVSPIRAVSQMTLPKRKVMAIEKDIVGIHDSLLNISRVVRRQESAFFSHGSITPEPDISICHQIIAKISPLFVFLKRTLKEKLKPKQKYPSTVSEAVRNANDRLVALVELTKIGNYPSEAMAQIVAESKKIQMLLYNIRVCGTSQPP